MDSRTALATALAMVATVVDTVNLNTVNLNTVNLQRNLSLTHGLSQQRRRRSLQWTRPVGTASISNTRNLGGNTSLSTPPNLSWPSVPSNPAQCSSPSSLVKPPWSMPTSLVWWQTQATYSVSENGAIWAMNAQTAVTSSILSGR